MKKNTAYFKPLSVIAAIVLTCSACGFARELFVEPHDTPVPGFDVRNIGTTASTRDVTRYSLEGVEDDIEIASKTFAKTEILSLHWNGLTSETQRVYSFLGGSPRSLLPPNVPSFVSGNDWVQARKQLDALPLPYSDKVVSPYDAFEKPEAAPLFIKRTSDIEDVPSLHGFRILQAPKTALNTGTEPENCRTAGCKTAQQYQSENNLSPREVPSPEGFSARFSVRRFYARSLQKIDRNNFQLSLECVKATLNKNGQDVASLVWPRVLVLEIDTLEDVNITRFVIIRNALTYDETATPQLTAPVELYERTLRDDYLLTATVNKFNLDGAGSGEQYTYSRMLDAGNRTPGFFLSRFFGIALSATDATHSIVSYQNAVNKHYLEGRSTRTEFGSLVPLSTEQLAWFDKPTESRGAFPQDLWKSFAGWVALNHKNEVVEQNDHADFKNAGIHYFASENLNGSYLLRGSNSDFLITTQFPRPASLNVAEEITSNRTRLSKINSYCDALF